MNDDDENDDDDVGDDHDDEIDGDDDCDDHNDDESDEDESMMTMMTSIPRDLIEKKECGKPPGNPCADRSRPVCRSFSVNHLFSLPDLKFVEKMRIFTCDSYSSSPLSFFILPYPTFQLSRWRGS